MKSACSTRSCASTPTWRNDLQTFSFFTMSRNSPLEIRLSPLQSTESRTTFPSVVRTMSMSIRSFSLADTRQATSQRIPMSMLVIVSVAMIRKMKNRAPKYHLSSDRSFKRLPWSGRIASIVSVRMAFQTPLKCSAPAGASRANCTKAIANTYTMPSTKSSVMTTERVAEIRPWIMNIISGTARMSRVILQSRRSRSKRRTVRVLKFSPVMPGLTIMANVSTHVSITVSRQITESKRNHASIKASCFRR
mmetsp:Transcript_96584/g.268465  ORF Transcript_96584/g.268465 Transcript_96584/m.268465 type:complete len:249 (+) Transcript_96584:829-1575(+)